MNMALGLFFALKNLFADSQGIIAAGLMEFNCRYAKYVLGC